jgi:TRAP-type C4-dicarboxylate transport system permease large subunit
MGLGPFSSPIGLGLCAVCGVCDVQMKHVIGPMTKHLVVIVADLVLLSGFRGLTTWMRRHLRRGNH